MQISGEPKAFVRSEAQAYINLYASLGDRAEIFLPKEIFDNLRNFVRLCYEEPNDPAKQQAEINAYLLKFREEIPGYVDVNLMLMPHEQSKAFQYSAQRNKFKQRLTNILDAESIGPKEKTQVNNIIDNHDLSVGTPPVTAYHLALMSQILLGEHVRDLRKYRDIIGVTSNVDEAHWNYLMDTLHQMISQSSHYTTAAETADFLHRSEWAVNFKGINGMIRTVVSGNADTVVSLFQGEVFAKESVRIVDGVKDDEEAEALFQEMLIDGTSVFVVKVKHARQNHFAGRRWFPHLSRLVIVDDSVESRSSNTSLVFSFHNGIINTLNKAQNKKLGSAASSQLNIRLILENVGEKQIQDFRTRIKAKIDEYATELSAMKIEQLGTDSDPLKDISLFSLDDFSRQIVKDKYALEKLHDFLFFLENSKNPEGRKEQTQELIEEFETRVRKYFYSGAKDLQIATIVEGGGRNQIRTYGAYLLSKDRVRKVISDEIKERSEIVLSIIPTNYQRTLRNHFHKNFGVNLFLEKYKEYLTKVDNESDNKGRYKNFLIDLGIYEDFQKKTDRERKIIGEFLSNLGTTDKTSVSDGVQMIILDLLFNENRKPYILYNQQLSWEYTDLLPEDRFDLNPFDIEIENLPDGRIAYDRLVSKLLRIKDTLALFDETGNLWDAFCENTSIVVNDPDNPSGYSDFNTEPLKNFLRFLNNTKITLFLDEAYQDAVKIEDSELPKWRTISRYIINNIHTHSKIRAVSSLSTTKNLGATGNRLGSLIGTPSAADIIAYAKKLNSPEKGNNNSLFMLNNIIAFAQVAKRIKDTLELELPQNASRHKIKTALQGFILSQIERTKQENEQSHKKQLHKLAGFEGSPLHLFLLDEIRSLGKLDVLGLPDDFKYGELPFFSYYHEHLLTELNKFRVNKNFRRESIKRLKQAKLIAAQVIENLGVKDVSIVQSDGSYLFNLQLASFSSYSDLSVFAVALAKFKGVAFLPYKTGMVRFSLGGYFDGSTKSYEVFDLEFTDSLNIFFKYWGVFQTERSKPSNKDKNSEAIVNQIFAVNSEQEFLESTLADYPLSRGLKKDKAPGVYINDMRTVYHASPQASGVSINAIGGSINSVFEFQPIGSARKEGESEREYKLRQNSLRQIGECRSVEDFIRSQAFTKVYEHLLAQIHKTIPQIKNLNFNTVASKYSKATLLKFIDNKKNFQPNRYVLDDPEELNTMREILIEMERVLFSDAKFKILSLEASEDHNKAGQDISRLEGVNRVICKYIQEILLHFNLPFQKPAIEPTRKEIMSATLETFEAVTGLKAADFDLDAYFDVFIRKIRERADFQEVYLANKTLGIVIDAVNKHVLKSSICLTDKILYLYLLKNDDSFAVLFINKLKSFSAKILATEAGELRLLTENILTDILEQEFDEVLNYIFRKEEIKVSQENLSLVTRKVVLFFVNLMNYTKGTQYFDKYTHTLMKMVETEFRKQNSSVNEMIQHGLTVYRHFDHENGLDKFDSGRLNWMNDLMSNCGVVSAEQPVQLHTRIVTDAKKREYPFHKVNREEGEDRDVFIENGKENANDFIKRLYSKPSSRFFEQRLANFVKNMDVDDYRCKIVNTGLVKELFVFQKSYIKYMTDNFRLNYYKDVSLAEAKNFVPDVVMFLGAPEKVISFPQVGFFDIDGPNGKIKTLVTPLKQEADYFGDVKKPRLTMINEKIKEMGGLPKHGSLFAVEEEDGSIFVVEIDGDSGVGKSEMLAALVLKWLRSDLVGIRSVKSIAGDMFHVFQDADGNLYGVGTEVGDFSRVTDFDPNFIRYYKYLFETSADSNVEDLNSRSTISGFCEITMPFKIDIMLTAHNYSKGEAGITRIDNPENFLKYIDSHGERKEKATSQDGPHFQRTLKRYTADSRIVELVSKHGNYLDMVLDWEFVPKDKTFYLCSSYKMIDKIDIEKVVLAMFLDKTYKNDGITYVVKSTRFDLITNRFYALASAEGQKDVEFVITRQFFGTHYDALASTPGGQPFIAEEGQEENINHLTKVLKGKTGKGAGAKIQCGILSTEIGKKGKEISGPKKAAEDMKRLIQEVRIMNPDININKNFVKKLINEKYFHIFNGLMNSSEVWRYNHYLYQLDTMKKADFRRIDDANIKVDLSSIAGFAPKNASDVFSPLLVTPNLNIELNAFGETFEELVELPNYGKMVQEFENLCNKLYIATGYSEETVVNNMIVQLLLMGHYIDLDDIARGKVAEKVNRETIAAAKKAVVNSMRSDWKPSTPTKPTTPPVAPVAEAPELSTPEVSDAPAANEASPKKGKK